MKTKQKRVVFGAVILILLITSGFSLNTFHRQIIDQGHTVYIPIIQKPAESTPVVEILPGTTTSLDPTDYLYIMGEVANHTGSPVWDIIITAKVYDSNDNILNSDSIQTNLTALRSNDKTCFDISLYAEPGWDHYTLETAYDTLGPLIPDLTVLGDQGLYDPALGEYDITGQVINNRNQVVNNVSPVGTLYNSEGSVVGCDYVFVDGYDLQPNATSNFDILFSQRDYIDVTDYRIQVDGQVQ